MKEVCIMSRVTSHFHRHGGGMSPSYKLFNETHT